MYCIVYPAGEWLTHQKSIIAHIYSDHTFFEVSKKYPYMIYRKRACFLYFYTLVLFLFYFGSTINCTLLFCTLNCEHLDLCAEVFTTHKRGWRWINFFLLHIFNNFSGFLRLEFCLVFYPHFSLLQNAVHEKTRVFLSRIF